jgi:hypothetical protein
MILKRQLQYRKRKIQQKNDRLYVNIELKFCNNIQVMYLYDSFQTEKTKKQVKL